MSVAQAATPRNDPPPAVSVVLPVFNGSAFIGAAIESILAQTYRRFELVVGDNASTDDTLDIVGRFVDPRICVIESECDLGAAVNWNRVVDASSGAYVKLVCADDLLYPTCLERQVEVLDDPEHAGVALVCAARDVVGPAGRRVMRRGFGRLGGRVDGGAAVRAVARSGANPIGEPVATLFRRSAWEAAGPFRLDGGYTIDLDLWLRLLMTGDLYVVGETLAAFRVSPGAWSTGLARRQAMEYRELLRRLAADPRYGVSRADVALGATRARLNAVGRRAIYRLYARKAA